MVSREKLLGWTGVVPVCPLARDRESFRIEPLLKAEGERRGTMGLEVRQATHRLRYRGPMPHGYPPEPEVHALEALEPVAPLAHDTGMRAPKDILPQCREIGPD